MRAAVCKAVFLVVAFFALDAFAQNDQVIPGEYVLVRKSDQPLRGPLITAVLGRSSESLLVRAGPEPAFSQQSTTVPYSAAEDQCSKLIANDPNILACSPNLIRELFKVPNDPALPALWALNGTNRISGVDAPEAWEVTVGEQSTVVAVIDTGIDYNHPDLAANIWINPLEVPGNGIDDENDGYIDDIHGISAVLNSGDPLDLETHGTHVSGTIAGRGNNALGVVGVNWQAALVGVGIFPANGGASVFDIVQGYNYVADLKQLFGVNIVAANASFGGFVGSEPERLAINRLRTNGILLVAAAGNDGLNTDFTPVFPADYNLDNIISVAAIDRFGFLPSFSNFGFNSVDIAAPGVDIFSTFPGSSFATLSGTSMATPHVTGAVALLASFNSSLDYLDLKNQILSSGKPLSSIASLVGSGKTLNLNNLLGGTPLTPTPVQTPISTITPSPTPTLFLVTPTPTVGPTILPFVFNSRYKIRGFGRKSKTKTLPIPEQFVLNITRKDFLFNAGPSSALLTFAVNGKRCRNSIEFADFLTAKVVLKGRTQKLEGFNRVEILVSNPLLQVTDKLVLRIGQGTKSTESSYTKAACSAIISSLR